MSRTLDTRARFDALRAKYVAASAARDELAISLRVKYGPGADPVWYSATERKRLDAAYARVDKAAAKMSVLVAEISPRSWESGVPAHWVYGELTYEDAVRPLSEPLSVTPPLAYGATQPMR